MRHDPSKPSYIVRVDGAPMAATQDPERAAELRDRWRRHLVRLDHFTPAQARERVRVETVPPEWPSATSCGRTDSHEPHHWGGSPAGARCAGVIKAVGSRP